MSIRILHALSFFRAIVLLPFFSTFDASESSAQGQLTIETYFEKIRLDEPMLTAFFSAMPKGGDLHNHFSGSLYAETYWQLIVERDFYIDTVSLAVRSSINSLAKNNRKKYVTLSHLSSKNRSNLYRQKLLKEWSIKDFDNTISSDMQFFESFKKFPHGDWDEALLGLKELVDRATVENVQYLEVMLRTIPFEVKGKNQIVSNDYLRSLVSRKDTLTLWRAFDRMMEYISSSGSNIAVDEYLKCLQDIHDKIPGEDVTLRYLAFVRRAQEPFEVFKNLVIAFQAAAKSSLIVGVNIVEREDSPLSMKDYKLHMMMFRYLKSQYPNVKCSLHAGELTLGLVKPEDLSFHIRDAVFVARANRIGHGVDIAYEKDALQLLNYMSAKKIPVEINLSSNEFILKVAGDQHPITLYKRQNVPIIISTDDAGILRTNLTRQYVLLAQRYPEFRYNDIKDIIINSLAYSFIEEADTKNSLKESLLRKLALFEEEIIRADATTK